MSDSSRKNVLYCRPNTRHGVPADASSLTKMLGAVGSISISAISYNFPKSNSPFVNILAIDTISEADIVNAIVKSSAFLFGDAGVHGLVIASDPRDEVVITELQTALLFAKAPACLSIDDLAITKNLNDVTAVATSIPLMSGGRLILELSKSLDIPPQFGTELSPKSRTTLSWNAFAPVLSQRDNLGREHPFDIPVWNHVSGGVFKQKHRILGAEFFEQDRDQQLQTLQYYYRHHFNEALTDPFVAQDDHWASQQLTWNSGNRAHIDTTVAGIIHAMTGGRGTGTLMVTAAGDQDDLPNIDFIKKGNWGAWGFPMMDIHTDIAFMMENMFAAWHPVGWRYEPISSRRLPIRRSDFQRSSAHYQLAVHEANYHDMIEATQIFRQCVEHISRARIWETDPCFGRRTNFNRADADEYLKRIITRYKDLLS